MIFFYKQYGHRPGCTTGSRYTGPSWGLSDVSWQNSQFFPSPHKPALLDPMAQPIYALWVQQANENPTAAKQPFTVQFSDKKIRRE